jgi:myo-inositol-1(or 4)-monophosphatase
MHPLVNIAVRAARRAGNVILRNLNRVDSLAVVEKGRNDFVTEVDRAAEQEIIQTVLRSYPTHGFLAEESGVTAADAEFVWVIDPLDGTTNFLHGFPQFCVSLGIQYRGKIEHAVVYDPWRQEIFTATRGDGAYLDGKRIRVTKAKSMDGALIGTGFPYRDNVHFIDPYMAMLKTVTMRAAGVRRPGSAALDLAYVAAGRTDGFWELGLSPWDTAAGTLLIQEAGGLVGTLTGGEYTLGPHIVAGGPKVYESLLSAIGPHLTDELRA